MAIAWHSREVNWEPHTVTTLPPTTYFRHWWKVDVTACISWIHGLPIIILYGGSCFHYREFSDYGFFIFILSQRDQKLDCTYRMLSSPLNPTIRVGVGDICLGLILNCLKGCWSNIFVELPASMNTFLISKSTTINVITKDSLWKMNSSWVQWLWFSDLDI